MPRPKRIRKMLNPPHFKGFKPSGVTGETSPVLMDFEEYEAIRLSDFELFGQVEAARYMGVSRPTFTRIYESARRKVALAFVEGRPIIFQGGKVYFDSEWYTCSHCGCFFNHPAKEQVVSFCTLCGSPSISQCSQEQAADEADICICPVCGYEKEHIPGNPCNAEFCPSCHGRMMRKGAPHRKRNR